MKSQLARFLPTLDFRRGEALRTGAVSSALSRLDPVAVIERR